jgi:UDP-N-acetylglucosamine:LPS N-acetylglucosamine transferase
MDEQPGLIVVISAAVGAGHDGAADELARRLRERGFRVANVDLLEVFPCRLGWVMNGMYHGLMNRAPWAYGALFAVTSRFRTATPVTRAMLRPFRGRLRRILPPDTQAVVSTYPYASQLLGSLRRQGHLTVPVITYLTDFSVHPAWVAPGVDVHCALHDTTGARARDLGAGDVRVVGPLVSAGFRPGSDATKRGARQRFGLPAEGRLALLVAGSWGVGEVEATAMEIARTGAAVPVVVCGRNAALKRRLNQRVRHVFGWVDDMPTLMRAADVVVENAGGLTSLEAMACGLPVATYRPIPGHGKANAASMAGAQVSSWIRRSEALAPTLLDLMDGVRGQRQRVAGLSLPGPDAANVVAAAAENAAPRWAADEMQHESRVRRWVAVASTVAGTLSPRLTGRHDQAR